MNVLVVAGDSMGSERTLSTVQRILYGTGYPPSRRSSAERVRNILHHSDLETCTGRHVAASSSLTTREAWRASLLLKLEEFELPAVTERYPWSMAVRHKACRNEWCERLLPQLITISRRRYQVAQTPPCGILFVDRVSASKVGVAFLN